MGPSIVVIGIGNPYRQDDGLGPEVARRLRPLAPEWVEVVEHDGEPAGLLDLWEGMDVAVVVDAVATEGSEPGEIHRVELHESSDLGASQPLSSHGIGPGDAVELARVLDRMPNRLVLYGVQGRSFVTGASLSPEVEVSVSSVVERVLEEVHRCHVR